jgi:transcription termination factor NusB
MLFAFQTKLLFLLKLILVMASFTLTSENSQKVKTKFLRKYRDLASAELDFSPGKEDELVQKLMKLVKRDQTYIEFTIQKALADPNGNRL